MVKANVMLLEAKLISMFWSLSKEITEAESVVKVVDLGKNSFLAGYSGT